jgi:hypothetical protein
MKSKIKLLLISFATVIMVLLGVVISSVPVAAAEPANSVLTLSYTVQTDRQGNQSLLLQAKLNQDNGYALSQRNIAFFEKTDIFGDANVPIGSAITSAVGVAALTYQTRVTGPHTFTVVYGGDDKTASAVVTATLDLQDLPPMPALYTPTGMEKISDWSMIATGVVVVVVWGLLASVFFGTIFGVRSASKGQ